MIATMEKYQGAKDSRLKKMPYNRREIKRPSILPCFPCIAKKVALLQQWIKDNIIYLPKSGVLSSTTDNKDLK